MAVGPHGEGDHSNHRSYQKELDIEHLFQS